MTSVLINKKVKACNKTRYIGISIYVIIKNRASKYKNKITLYSFIVYLFLAIANAIDTVGYDNTSINFIFNKIFLLNVLLTSSLFYCYRALNKVDLSSIIKIKYFNNIIKILFYSSLFFLHSSKSFSQLSFNEWNIFLLGEPFLIWSVFFHITNISLSNAPEAW